MISGPLFYAWCKFHWLYLNTCWSDCYDNPLINSFYFHFIRIFTRQAILLFQRPKPAQLSSQTMAERKAVLDLAAKNASTAFLEALCLVEHFLDENSLGERTSISKRIEEMFPVRIRSPELYCKVMGFTSKVSAWCSMTLVVTCPHVHALLRVTFFMHDIQEFRD